MKKKQYKDFNKSLWFLFPIIADPVLIEDKKKSSREVYLIDTDLINTYLYPTVDNNRLYYVKYKNTPEVVNIEDYLTCDYLEDVIYAPGSTTFIYNIKKEQDVETYDLFVDGKYSQINLDYKWRVTQMFKLTSVDYLWKVFKKDDNLWHSINKSLGCKLGSSCSCKIEAYPKCTNFEKFEMPNRLEIELEEKIDILKETIEL